jgi:acyl carrier protein
MKTIAYEEVVGFVADHFQVERAALTPQTRLVDDLYADSLELLDLVLDLNERYGIEIEADDLQQMTTVAALATVLQRLMLAAEPEASA